MIKPFNFPLIITVGAKDGAEIAEEIANQLGVTISIEESKFIGELTSKARCIGLGHKYIINLKDWDGSNLAISTLCHEVHHLMNFVLLDICEKRGDNEWEAYFIGCTILDILNQLDALCSKK